MPTSVPLAAPAVAPPRRVWHPAIADYSRMLAVGTAGFGIDFALFNVLLQVGVSPNTANLLAMVVSSAAVFGANLHWTFDHRDVALPHHSVLKFVLVQGLSVLGIALGMVVVTGLTSSVVVWNLAKFLFTIGIGFGRFYLYREWVYSDHGQQPAA